MNSTSRKITALQLAIEPLRNEIIHHPAYSSIHSLDDLRTFMEYHVYAVWDFMSLLKALQNQLTCTSVPWLPVGDANTRYLINEIVVGEESDIDLEGVRKSHFEMYLDAMKQAGADMTTVNRFIDFLKKGKKVEEALASADAPSEAADFVRYTFEIIRSGKIHVLSAVFTFGREDLIPDMFLSIIQELQNKFPQEVSRFKYYIDRHIEVDGGHHSHLALEMTSQLCEDDQLKWTEAQEAVVKALKMRKKLWDGVYQCIGSESVKFE
ncbi:MAG: DUF3050 domain-containing protein [Thermaurantimonas sp.]|uniref:DUF3050 domain-containing protein n=1 Tax=Thermaurantimonas sp. TaxID=2681568 RepID=UPI00391BB574